MIVLLWAMAHAIEPECRVSWDAAPLTPSVTGLRVEAGDAWFAISGAEGTVGLDAVGACTLGATAPRGVPAGAHLVSRTAAGDLEVRERAGAAWAIETVILRADLPHAPGARTPALIGSRAPAFLLLTTDDALRAMTSVDRIVRAGSDWTTAQIGAAALAVPVAVDEAWTSSTLSGLWPSGGPTVVSTDVSSAIPLPDPPSRWHARTNVASDGRTILVGLEDGLAQAVGVWTTDASGATLRWEARIVPECAEDGATIAGLAVEGNVAVVTCSHSDSPDTGTAEVRFSMEIWRRGVGGWMRSDAWSPIGADVEVGASVALTRHVITAGSLGRQPGVATTALARLVVPVVDADGDGIDETEDTDDLHPDVPVDTDNGPDTDPPDSDSRHDTGTKDDGRPRCGCDATGGGGSVLGLLGLWFVRRRARVRTTASTDLNPRVPARAA